MQLKAVNRRKDAQRLHALAAAKFEKALLLCSSAKSTAAVDDSNAFVLAAFAKSVCSILRAADVTASSQRWSNLTRNAGNNNQVKILKNNKF